MKGPFVYDNSLSSAVSGDYMVEGRYFFELHVKGPPFTRACDIVHLRDPYWNIELWLPAHQTCH